MPAIFTLIFSSSFAQRAPRKAELKPAKPVLVKSTVQISNDGHIEYFTIGNVERLGDSLAVRTIYIPFDINGPAPAKDVVVTLNLINEFTTARPVFDNRNTTKDIVIEKELFNGKPHTINQGVLIKFNLQPAISGEANIRIGKGGSNVRLNFDYIRSAADIQVKTNVKPDEKSDIPQTPLSKPAVALVSGSTDVSLDTLLSPNITFHKYAKVKLRLNRSEGKDTIIKFDLFPVGTLENIKLAGTDAGHATLKLYKHDWDDTKEVEIERDVRIDLEQAAALSGVQLIDIYLPDGKVKHTFKINPYTSKKKAVYKPIAAGGAEIVPGATANIERRYGSVISALDTISVRVKFNGNFSPEANQLLFGFADTALNKTYQIIENPITVTREEWVQGSKKKPDLETELKTAMMKDGKDESSASTEAKIQAGKMTEGILVPLHIRTIKATDTLNTVRDVDLVIKGQTQILRGSQRLKVIVPDRTFWAEVGTNFDLLDNIKTNNFYAAIFGHMKDVATLWSKKHPNNISFVGGVYESQSVSQSSSLSSGFTYRDGSSNILDSLKKGYPYYTDTGRIQSTTSVKSIGLMFSPQIRLNGKRLNEDGFHWSISTYFELLWQRITSTIDYSKTARNIVAYDSTLTALNGRTFKEGRFDFDSRSHYIGAGLSTYIKESDYTLYLNGILGTTNQGFTIVNPSRIGNSTQFKKLYDLPEGYLDFLNAREPKHRWNAFYVIQYRLTEVAFGLTFSGEVRGLLLKGAKPVVTLALSKKFDLTALLKPLLAPF
ncbi:hypothetical protein DYU05_09550 [Mucilaginibacter terrenus]|uniref:Uncharacterized protein n=2 Tax=Mucilaginibacter terrenus TaxID=2482727 RepID=A0A3E2NXV4_9SPHI|nr:hypothetical protein DYU05_09550 [Mucilaginibacter terrenus]